MKRTNLELIERRRGFFVHSFPFQSRLLRFVGSDRHTFSFDERKVRVERLLATARDNERPSRGFFLDQAEASFHCNVTEIH